MAQSSRRRAQIHNFRKMLIYKRALTLVATVYRLIGRLPREETFGLGLQLRRAVVSVPLNIAEGSGSSTDQEFARFLEIARRSLYEVSAGFDICVLMRLLSEEDCAEAMSESDELAAMISGFRARLRCERTR